VTWRVVLPRCAAVNRKHAIECGEIRPFVRSTDRNRVACTGSPGRASYHRWTSVLPVLCTALINPTSRACAVYVLLLYLGARWASQRRPARRSTCSGIAGLLHTLDRIYNHMCQHLNTQGPAQVSSAVDLYLKKKVLCAVSKPYSSP
jgi:hypothetical protein